VIEACKRNDDPESAVADLRAGARHLAAT